MPGAEQQDRFVYSWRVRAAASAYIAASVGVGLVLGARAGDRQGYLTSWVVAAALPLIPTALLAPRALRDVAPGERASWRLWTVGWAVVYGGALLVYLVGVHGWAWLRAATAPMALLAGVGFGVGNAMALRRRSGRRGAPVDLIDVVTTALAIAGPLGLLFGDRIVDSDHSWLTVPAALAAVGLVHGCIALLLISLRVPADRRGLVLVAFAFLVASLVDAAGQVAQGVTGFALPAAPLVALHALVMGGSLLMVVMAVRNTGPGLLDRLPPQRQVRKNGLMAGVVLVTMALTATIAVVRREHGWVVVAAIGLMMTLLVLSTIRQLFLARETVRLYGEVEQAADERRELLAEVMRSLDTDHHRAAIHLHKQAASLYTAMTSFAQALDWLPGREVPAAVGIAAERVRFDLARRVDASQQILTAIEPGTGSNDGLLRLVTLTRAHVGNLWGDVRRPELRVDVDERLAVDWTHEVVVFRIVQLAIDNVWRHADAGTVWVSIAAPHDALTVRITDDGRGFEPGTVQVGSGIATMQTLVAYVDGHLEIESGPGDGTSVTAVLGATQPRPRLRVVRDAT